jgi:hypothetical protein
VRGLQVRAVLTGVLVDIGGSLLAQILIFVVLGLTIPNAPDRAGDAPQNVAVPPDPAFWGPLLAIGLLFTALGAYVAARIAKGAELENAFAVGIVSTAIGFTFVFLSPEASPFWVQAAGLLLTIPAAFVGGLLRVATRTWEQPRR